MSNPGEWIDFAELCERVKSNGLNKSPRTLRRYYKTDRLISYRQAKRGGRVEFNWRTVMRELRALETGSIYATAAVDDVGDASMREQLGEVLTLVRAIADKVGAK